MAEQRKKATTLGATNYTKSKHPLYSTYKQMVQRCHLPTAHDYRFYGARGITVDEEWRQDFWKFVKDVGVRPEGMTLDRIDSARGYGPGNVRWATRWQQSCNTRRNTDHIGVYFKRSQNKWYARIMVDRKLHFGPLRESISEAIRDRARLERELKGVMA